MGNCHRAYNGSPSPGGLDPDGLGIASLGENALRCWRELHDRLRKKPLLEGLERRVNGPESPPPNSPVTSSASDALSPDSAGSATHAERPRCPEQVARRGRGAPGSDSSGGSRCG
jgi:hypothetical protein